MAVIALLTDAERFPFDADNEAALEAAGVDLRSVEGHNASMIAEAGRDAAAIFVYHATVDTQLFEALPSLRLVARCGTGVDRIDLDAARAAGVRVTHVPGFATGEVADHTIGLLLACARRIVSCDRSMRAGRWLSSTEIGELRRLRGQTLGLVGFGLIARAVVRRARALGLSLVAHDPYADGQLFVELETEAVGLDELLERSDYVSLHAPLTEATRGMIGASELARMGRGATLLNTGRGELVDEDALVNALRSGQLGAAGLDVYQDEPLANDSPLLDLEQVILEPHSAAFSDEALAELRRRAVAHTIAVLGGAELEGVLE